MAALACGLSLACQDMGPVAAIPNEARSAKPNSSLQAGDELGIAFSGAPELNTRQKIQPNGKLSLPVIGDVHAAGRSLNGLQASITSLYQPHLQDPSVVISITSASAGVYVSGAVMRPGKIPLDRPMTALEAVMECGGFSTFANPRRVIVVRNQDGNSQRYVLNMDNTLKGMDSRSFYLRPFDVIYVRQTGW